MDSFGSIKGELLSLDDRQLKELTDGIFRAMGVGGRKAGILSGDVGPVRKAVEKLSREDAEKLMKRFGPDGAALIAEALRRSREEWK